MPALLVGGVLLVLIGGFGFTHAAGRPPIPPSSERPGSCRSAPSPRRPIEPIEGVSIEYRVRFGGKNREATVATGKDGLATIDYPPDAGIDSFELTARKAEASYPSASAGATRHTRWKCRHRRRCASSRARPSAASSRTRPAIRSPAPGRRLRAPDRVRGPEPCLLPGDAQTDAQGRWRLDVAPKDLGGVWVNVRASALSEGPATAASRDLEGVIVLTRGLTVTGRVVDAGGRPVKGARAIIGHDVSGRTVRPGRPTIGASSPWRTATRARPSSRCRPRASRPGSRKSGSRSTDRARGHHALEPGATPSRQGRGRRRASRSPALSSAPTPGAGIGRSSSGPGPDADGRFEWRGAPRDAVLYDVFKHGYMSSRSVPLIASDREQVVTLYPELVISGRVTDAETGRPLPRFRLIPGGRNYEATGSDPLGRERGRGSRRGADTRPGSMSRARPSSSGSRPRDTSRPSRAPSGPTEGGQTFDFALRRGEGLSGVVLLPDGKPAEGAEVVLATDGVWAA